MQRRCPHCQNELPEDASFCLCCFSRLIDPEPAPEPPVSRWGSAALGAAGAAVLLSASAAAIWLSPSAGSPAFSASQPDSAGLGAFSSTAAASDTAHDAPGGPSSSSGAATASDPQVSSWASTVSVPFSGTESASNASDTSSFSNASTGAPSPVSSQSEGRPPVSSGAASVSSSAPPASSSDAQAPSEPDDALDGNLIDFSRYPYASATDFSWVPYEGGVSITRYKGAGGVVRIPPTLGGLPVIMIDTAAFRDNQTITHVQVSAKWIGNEAFWNCQHLVQVDLPGVQIISIYAFTNTSALESVTLYDGLIYIEPMAFSGCISLTRLELPSTLQRLTADIAIGSSVRSLTLPASVTSFENDANIMGNENLEEILVDPANPDYYSVDGVLFLRRGAADRSDDLLVYYPPGRPDASYTICTDVAPYAFSCARVLEEITFTGQRALTIGVQAFQFCAALTRVQFSAPIGELGAYAFMECDGLLSFTLPAEARVVGFCLFEGCNNLKEIYVPGTLDLSGLDRPVAEGLYRATLYVKRGSPGEAHAKQFTYPYTYY